MKIARYRFRGRECYGILDQQGLLCLPDLARICNMQLPRRIEDFVSLDKQAAKTVESLVSEKSGKNFENLHIPVERVSLLAPIHNPAKIICLGLNYLDHAEETGATIPKEPIIFMKPPTAIIGPSENIIKPGFVKQLDYEGELAIVIGKTAKNVSVSEARDHIFGYTILNDVSAREIQFGDKQWTRGKSFDTFAPTGPWITTAEQLKDTAKLSIRTWVNDDLRQNSSTEKMVFNVSEIVHHLSRVMTLKPCDMIATGTPAGVGFAMKPPRFLKKGDTIRIEIEGIGTLQNVVEEADG